MAENSKIGWTDHTMNFWWGCNKVSTECTHCYIGQIMRRSGHEPFGGPMRTNDWTKPRKWKAATPECDRRQYQSVRGSCNLRANSASSARIG
jgi:hypothetical protein